MLRVYELALYKNRVKDPGNDVERAPDLRCLASRRGRGKGKGYDECTNNHEEGWQADCGKGCKRETLSGRGRPRGGAV